MQFSRNRTVTKGARAFCSMMTFHGSPASGLAAHINISNIAIPPTYSPVTQSKTRYSECPVQRGFPIGSEVRSKFLDDPGGLRGVPMLQANIKFVKKVQCFRNLTKIGAQFKNCLYKNWSRKIYLIFQLNVQPKEF